MDPVTTAALHIADAFPNGGRTILVEAGLASWADALVGLPPRLLTSTTDGALLLARVRDYWYGQGRLREALVATQALVRLRVQSHGQQHADTLVELGALGALAHRLGKLDEARQTLEATYRAMRSAVGDRDVRLAVIAGHLGTLYTALGDTDAAIRVLEHAFRIRKELEPTSVGLVAAQLAGLFGERGDVANAASYAWEAWERYRESYGTSDDRTVARARLLLAVLKEQKRHQQAIPVMREVLAAAEARGEAELLAETAFDLGLALFDAQKDEEGYRLVALGVERTRHIDGTHPKLPERLTSLVRILLDRRQPGEAEGLLREALEVEKRLHGDASPDVAVRLAQIGRLAGELGRLDEAMGWLDPAASLLRSSVGDSDPRTRIAVEYLVEVLRVKIDRLLERRDRATARALHKHALDIASKVLGPAHRVVGDLRRMAP